MSSNNEMITSNIYNEFIEFNNDNEPGVINYVTLMNLALQQAPKGEAGKLYQEDGIKLNEIDEIRIEFLRILKIDHLWYMTNLVKLTLSHNIIKKIEGLDALIKLRELDLSFNSIEIMENLNLLVKLEILILTGNKIMTIQSIDNLKDLNIFNIADNKINEWQHILYLRQFKNLKSINIADNPCTLQDNYYEYFVAFLPQVIYYSYVMIRDDERAKAIELYRRNIDKVEEDESNAKLVIEREYILLKKNSTDSNAFVDHLDDDELFTLLFIHDKDGMTLKNINENTLDAFDNCKINFSTICHELYEYGMEQYSQRVNEIELFTNIVNEARDIACNNSRMIIDTMEKQKDDMLLNFNNKNNELNMKCNNELTTSEQSESQIQIKMKNIQIFTEKFNEILSEIWTKLIYSEVILHEQIEDISESFKINMTDMKDNFVDSIRSLFSKMRNIMVNYNDKINKIISIYINNNVEHELEIPTDLHDICGDINILNNTLATSHDFHLQTIDGREDDIIRKTNEWLNNLIENMLKEESTRHRKKILEISHFLQYHRELIHNHIVMTDNLATDVVAALDG